MTMTEKQDPSIEELQAKVTQLTAERDKLATDLKAAQSFKTQYDELKVKYDGVVQTNMDFLSAVLPRYTIPDTIEAYEALSGYLADFPAITVQNLLCRKFL